MRSDRGGVRSGGSDLQGHRKLTLVLLSLLIIIIMIMHYSVLYINWPVRACVTFLLCALCLVSRSQPVSRGPLRFGNSLVYCHTRFCSRTHRFSVGANELLMHYYVTGCGAH